jgi:thiol-disulfide isomerase/thioredoxin
LPHLVALAEKYKNAPVVVVSIDPGKRPKGFDQLLASNNVVHTALNDAKSEVFKGYRVIGTPTTAIIDPTGRLMFRHVGYSPGDERVLDKEIETLLKWMKET